MPTVFRLDGFSFRIYFNDHTPPHVHVIKAEGQAKISLDADKPMLLEVEKMSRKDTKKALQLTTIHRDNLLAKWRDIYG